MRYPSRHLLGILLALLALILLDLMTLPGSETRSAGVASDAPTRGMGWFAPTSKPGFALTPIAIATPVPCGWNLVDSPNPDPDSNSLFAVAAIASNDVWAVGDYGGHPLTEHWDGTHWSVLPVPSPDSGDFGALAAIASNDVWAVGNYGNSYDTLVEHWDGSQWSIVPSPNRGSSNYLKAITAVESDDVWAVGYYCCLGFVDQTLIEHWDGQTWNIVPSPNANTNTNVLYGVAAVSANDVWAVGFYADSTTSLARTLIEHWDGNQWNIFPSPNPPGASAAGLYGVAAVSPNGVWAVGHSGDSAGTHQTLIERWDGDQWHVVPSPNAQASVNWLFGVSARSMNDAWAVGYYCCPGPVQGSLVLHWDGGSWGLVSHPDPGAWVNVLSGVAAVSSSDVWAVGYYWNGNGTPYLTLVEHYTGACSYSTPTVTSTARATQTVTATAIATVTPACGPDRWIVGSNYPAPPLVGALGVYYPPNGRFYSLGGSLATSPYEYDPSTNTWTRKSAIFPDNQTNNMVGGALTAGGGPPDIYLVGGNAAGAITTTAAVRVYNPISDTITTLTSDPWPGDAAGDILPGGFAVFNDKLYILGGFQVNTGMTNQIWEFDPNGTAGNRWHRKTATLPVALGYIPAATIGNYIYTAGGSQFSGGTLIDTDFAYRYDPVADSITPIARIPRPTGETRAVNLGGRLWVLGGGRVSPNPSNEVDVYEPGTNTWTIGPSFLSSRRSFPADSDGSRYIWLAGGYNPGKPLAGTEIFTVGGQCGSPTSTATPTVVANTPTRTATGTPTVTATATLCTITFSDVHPSDYFYPAVTYLYCHGVIYGYGDNTFRPYNNTTRGQMSKIVTLGFGLPIWTPEPSATPTFRDVPRTDAFFDFIETAAHNQIVSGYGDGTYRPYNNVTRGQLCKIVVLAAAIVNRWPIINPPTPTFNDVPIGSPFYTYIETAYCHGIISGYGNGSFRPGNETTRGQISKIEHLAILDSILCKAALVVQ